MALRALSNKQRKQNNLRDFRFSKRVNINNVLQACVAA
jgi:hypothetical protein